MYDLQQALFFDEPTQIWIVCSDLTQITRPRVMAERHELLLSRALKARIRCCCQIICHTHTHIYSQAFHKWRQLESSKAEMEMKKQTQ